MSVKVIVRVAPVMAWPEFRLGPEFMQAVELLVHLLKPASMAAFLLAFWRFRIAGGVMSHWQIWAALGMSMLAGQSFLSRRLVRN